MITWNHSYIAIREEKANKTSKFSAKDKGLTANNFSECNGTTLSS